MDELIASLLKGFKERVKSTLWLNFCFAWIIFNWKFFVILFFEPDLTFRYVSKLDYITQKISQFSKCEPIIYAIIFTFGMPLLNLGVLVWQRRVVRWKEKAIVWVEKIKGPIDSSRLVDTINLLDIERKKNIETKANFDKLNEENNQLNQTLKNYSSDFENNIANPLKESINDYKNQVQNLITEKNELSIKFQPYISKQEITAYSCNFNGIEENYLEVLHPYFESEHLLQSVLEKSKVDSEKSFFTFTNEYVRIKTDEFKILSISRSKIEFYNFTQTIITTENRRIKSKMTTIKIIQTNKFMILLFFNYYESNKPIEPFISQI